MINVEDMSEESLKSFMKRKFDTEFEKTELTETEMTDKLSIKYKDLVKHLPNFSDFNSFGGNLFWDKDMDDLVFRFQVSESAKEIYKIFKEV